MRAQKLIGICRIRQFFLDRILCNNVKLSYLTGSSEQKMLERSIRATPFPTNALFPWKLVAPRVHRPSKSEKTDTTSPAFISADHFKAFHSIPHKKPQIRKTYCFVPTFWAANNPRGKDVSASQDGAATLSTDHHLRADLLHVSEIRETAALFPHTFRLGVPLIPGSIDGKKQHIWNLWVSKNLQGSLLR